ncbi:TPA: 30S ribosomal protein S3 [Candidatus Collierbacteria bacterium]|uniref:Small ribosomal subunit protein uS3 n=2 Tax=root TaxID=1 RepID=A0A0G1I0Q3_9BACT|nr:30S ribosomal protein S3 [uncultured organism]KKT43059.1 MAG: 30S ribosomal protein S3 [Candidatus Collierbacteria bacterium GW2011_GWA2_44_13]KKT51397.1 MAG: 30S ribosomal protein S3 [Candidatus Collierbacteria bacterium GW2011_GWB1_44_197]KKT52403.1 MAG: 30S ribosomal protein S3 [Candidatus Collierbacteria bacterium GW2011_GWB2_44_22]KKT62855.1 MAG: 30S ribosomal protein S3 [Candidatus Collierbacteria bacterium GW2011_GWD1_44_27]KKT66254.1 MAG: 30S ribosomal protein S3 [Candidatus Collier
MGKKVNPIAFRTGYIFPTKSVWFANFRSYAKFVLEDNKIRRFLEEKLKLAGITSIEIKRSINSVDIFMNVSRPGVVIGRGGSSLEILKKDLEKLLRINPKAKNAVKINLHPLEIKNPDINSSIIADRLIGQLEHRYPFRRAANQAIEKVMAAGAKGVKLVFAGRIDGAEIARVEKFKQGRIPTQTLRANIDYIEKRALTRSGYVGIKVWIYTGDIIS